MKRLNLLILSVLLVAFAGCHKVTTEGVTQTTYYVDLALEGDDYIFLAKGSSFVEPGYSAIENDEDISSRVVVTSNINSNTPGAYTVNYKVANQDGFTKTASRTVIVYPTTGYTTDVSGLYQSDLYREVTPSGSGGKTPSMPLVTFDAIPVGNGTTVYEVNDLLGGWYSSRYYDGGESSAYLDGVGWGIVAIDAAGNITILDSYIPLWGSYVILAPGKTNAVNADGTISLATKMSDAAQYIFYSELTKVVD